MKRYIFFIFLSLTFSAKIKAQTTNYCIPNRFSETAIFDSSDIQITSNIVFAIPVNYFTGAHDTLKMDIFEPNPAIDPLSKRPFILLIHGGAFLAGSKADMNYKCMEFARRGFVTATIDYRLGWNCPATDFLNICVLCGGLNYNLMTATYCAAQDGRAAMRFISANAPAYEIDTSFLFIGGESAGSITALHTTFWDQTEANAFWPNAIPAVGALDNVGNNLTNTYSIKGVLNSCGAVTKDSIVLNNGDIPMISFADEYDCIVPPGYGQVISCVCQPFYWTAGSTILNNLLTSNGRCSQYHKVLGSVNHCSFPQPEIVKNTSCFLKNILCNTCTSSYSTDIYAPVACSTLSEINENIVRIESLYFTIQNPVNEELEIKFSKATNQSCIISISNVLGQNFFKTNIDKTDESFKINVSELPAGIYIVNVSGSLSSVSQKLIKIN